MIDIVSIPPFPYIRFAITIFCVNVTLIFQAVLIQDFVWSLALNSL